MITQAEANGEVERVCAALRRQLRDSPEHARAMPGEFYTSERWLDVERRELFGNDWVCVGRVEEVENSGDYLVVEICGESIIVVRDQRSRLRAMSNVCRHRGMLVAQGKGNTQRFVCPYHNWRYELDGALSRAPLMSKRDDFDMARCALPPVSIECWLGFMFVSLSTAPLALAPQLTSAQQLAHNYHFEQMRTRYLTEEVWETNWKCLTENFMEGYHLSPLHKDTLHKVNPTRLCKHYAAGERHFGCFSGFAQHLEGAANGDGSVKGHPDLSEQQSNTSLMMAVAPNLLIGGAGDYSSFVCIQPIDAGHVWLKYGLMFYGDDWDDAAVEEAVELGKETIAEDRVALVGVQRGVSSKFYEPGPLAPADYEGTLHDFFAYIARRLLNTVD